MKLKFEGTNGEVDHIIYTIKDQINECDKHILDCIDRKDLNYLKWWQLHKAYLLGIVNKFVVDND